MAENFGLEASIHPDPPHIDAESISADNPEAMAQALKEIIRYQAELPRYADDLKDSLGRNFLAANAAINKLRVLELVADILRTEKLYLGDGMYFTIDGVNRRIEVWDQQTPSVKRLEFGLFGGGADAGLRGYDSTGNLVFTLGSGLRDIVKDEIEKKGIAAGLGQEQIYAVYNSETLPSALRPLDSWGWGQATTVTGGGETLEWHNEIQSVSATKRFLYTSGRVVPGDPSEGDTVTDTWSTPAILSRWANRGQTGKDGVPGEDGTGVEYTYAKYASDTLPARLRPSNAWGYLVADTIATAEHTLTPGLTFSRSSVYTGTSVTIEPPHATRQQITDTNFLHITSPPDTRYFGALRLYGTNPPNPALEGHIELQFTDEQTRAVREGDAGQDLASDFETRGRVTVTINDSTVPVADRTLTFSMAAADTTEPYIFKPTNSADVVRFADRFKVKGTQTLTASIRLEILSATDTITWRNSKEGVTLDKTNKYLWQAGRIVIGTPDEGDAVADDWSVPAITGAFGEKGDKGDKGDDGADGVFSPDDVPDNAILTRMLKDAAITGTKIANSAVSSDNLRDAAVQASKLANQAVKNSKIDVGAVYGNVIAGGAITGTHIQTGGIQAETVVAHGSITTKLLGANIITANEIAAGAINSNDMFFGKIIANKNLGDGSITAIKIKAGTITADRLRADVRNVRVLWPSPGSSTSGVRVRSDTSWTSFSLSDDLDDYYQIQGVGRPKTGEYVPWAVLVDAITTSGTSFALAAGTRDDNTAKMNIRKSGSRGVQIKGDHDGEEATFYDIIGIKNPATATPDPDPDPGGGGGTGTPGPGDPRQPSGTHALLDSGFIFGMSLSRQRFTAQRRFNFTERTVTINSVALYSSYQISARTYGTPFDYLNFTIKGESGSVTRSVGLYVEEDSNRIVWEIASISMRKQGNRVTFSGFSNINSTLYREVDSDGAVDQSSVVTYDFPLTLSSRDWYITNIRGVT